MIQCSKCEENKESIDFSSDKSRQSGRYPYCKTCASKYTQDRRRLNPVTEITIEQKKCPRCKTIKEVKDFSRNKSQHDGLKPWCKACDSTAKKKVYRKTGNRDRYLVENYGISLEDFNIILLNQNSGCAICRVIPEENLSVDHDHITGEVRGLLCRQCNLAIGNMHDNIGILKAAIAYLGGE